MLVYFSSKYLKQCWSAVSKGLKKNERGTGNLLHPTGERKTYVFQDSRKNTLVYLDIHFASIQESISF